MEQTDNPVNSGTDPQPAKSFNLYRRVMKRKYVFTDAASQPQYYILAPPKWKRTKIPKKWQGIVYRGGNPKYDEGSRIVAQTRLGFWWRWFNLELGPAVEKEVKSAEREVMFKKWKWKNWWRKMFGKEEKPFIWPGGEGEEAEKGERNIKTAVKLVHDGHRIYVFVVDGRTYRLSGTRRFAGKIVKGMNLKGVSHNIKLVRMEDHKLLAVFQKSYFSFPKSEPEKHSTKIGRLHIFSASPQNLTSMGRLSDEDGELDELLIVQAVWCMIEAECQKREIIEEVLKKAGKQGGGGGD